MSLSPSDRRFITQRERCYDLIRYASRPVKDSRLSRLLGVRDATPFLNALLSQGRVSHQADGTWVASGDASILCVAIRRRLFPRIYDARLRMPEARRSHEATVEAIRRLTS